MKYVVTLKAYQYFEFTVEADHEAGAFPEAHKAFEAAAEEIESHLVGEGPPELEDIYVSAEGLFGDAKGEPS